jgi:hypothetical protein
VFPFFGSFLPTLHSTVGVENFQNPLNKASQFFLEIGQEGYQRIRIFMLIATMKTYRCDKMHIF